MSHDIPEKLQAARFLCSQHWPYLSSALFSVQMVEDQTLGTYAVDKWWRLYYDPRVDWSVESMATVLYHEMSHLLRNHSMRAELYPELDHNAWNACADAEINDDLSSENFCKWPNGPVRDLNGVPVKDKHGKEVPWKPVMPKDLKQADGLLAEEYYSKLPKMTIHCQGCGSGSGGQKRPGELDGPAGKGGNSETTGMSPGEADLMRRHVAEQIKNSPNRGTIPGHWQRWAEEICNPKVDWKKVLKAQVKHSLADITGKMDYTFRKPHRRNPFPHVVLPTMQQPIPRVAEIWDVSGSMNQTALNTIMTESKGIFRSCGISGHRVYVVDAAVHSAKKVYDPRQVELTGGGGTDMRVGITAALSVPRQERPHLLIVLTDGYTPWPDIQPPGVKMIVVLVNTAANEATVPGWAKVIKVD